MKKGLFITFEGTDGSGKTTQLDYVRLFLRKKGLECVVTREPGALDFGKKIREILLHSKENITDKAEMFLFLADRAQHIQTLIQPSLNAGKIVLCDRHVDSTIAYQGYGRKQDIELLKQLNSTAVGGIKPDLTLLFDVPVEIALKRTGSDKDRMESEGIEFQKAVRNGYLELQTQDPLRIKLINAANPVDIVYNDVKKEIEKLITQKLGD